MPRVTPHAKLHVSLKNHRKTAQLFADNDLLAAYTRILLLAVERFADRTEDSFTVHKSELMVLAGKKRADSALRLVRYLSDTSPILVQSEGSLFRITVPNFAKKQGFHARKGNGTGDPTTTTSTTTKRTDFKARASTGAKAWANGQRARPHPTDPKSFDEMTEAELEAFRQMGVT